MEKTLDKTLPSPPHYLENCLLLDPPPPPHLHLPLLCTTYPSHLRIIDWVGQHKPETEFPLLSLGGREYFLELHNLVRSLGNVCEIIFDWTTESSIHV